MRFQIYSKPSEIFSKMLEDISNAKESIILETYIYGNDSVGRRFRDLLIKKAKQGVSVRLLVDSWGSFVKKNFFNGLVNSGGEVRFFQDMTHIMRFLTKTHEVSHRKLLVVDDKIVHVGSSNIADLHYMRELNLRLESSIAQDFKKSFNLVWDFHGKISTKKIKTVIHRGYEIIEDIPGRIQRVTQNKYVDLINSAKKEILIETPYFVPPYKIRDALFNAVSRGVRVKILLPYISDVGLADIVRTRYLGKLYREGIELDYFVPGILHSKLLLVDDNIFLLGSSNLDYRSFLHQHEINIFGRNKQIHNELKKFFYDGLKKSRPFDYWQWKYRSSFRKIVELILSYLDYYF